MKVIVKILCLVGLVVFSISSYSQAPRDYSFTKPADPALENDFNKYKVKLLGLADSGLPIKQYIKERDKLVKEFSELRRSKYQALIAKGKVTCEAKAPRPSPPHGRNQDSCTARLPISDSDIGDWLYDSNTVTELGQLQGGKSTHSVNTAENKHDTHLYTHCISPYNHEIDSGHCGITMRLNANFKMSDKLVNERVNAEILQLLAQETAN